MTEYNIRMYRGESEDEAIVAMMQAAEKFDGEEKLTTLERFRQENTLPGLDLSNNYFLAETADGQIVGHVFVTLRPSSVGTHTGQVALEVHPDWRNSTLSVTENLIKRAEARFLERKAELPPGGSFSASLSAKTNRRDLINLYERLGYYRERAFYDMIFSPLQGVALDIPDMPDGLTVRIYRPGADDEAFINARNDVWQDHYGGNIRTLEWWRHIVQEEQFMPELVFLAETKDGQIAGFCWCVIFLEELRAGGPREGWVSNLGVRRAWRNIGLGKALLMRGLAALAEKGMEHGMLGVDAESPTKAVQLYEAAGFKIHKTRLLYAKNLS